METAASFLSSQARNASLVQELEGLVTSIVKVLVSTIEAKDLYTRGHSERVAAFAKTIAQEMGFSEEEANRIHFTGLLHDIGKIGIPDAVLQKPGKLTERRIRDDQGTPGGRLGDTDETFPVSALPVRVCCSITSALMVAVIRPV